MQTAGISVERDGQRWAIKHNGGFLGHVRSEAEARRLAQSLTDHQGRAGPAARPRCEAQMARPEPAAAPRLLLDEPMTAAA